LPALNGKTQWQKHLIDDTVSQFHTLHMADLDGDGLDELITGKRVFAHINDPGAQDPPILLYYRWNKGLNNFTRHIINEGTVGTGLQIRTADINNDKAIDIVVAGKSGTYVLINPL